MGSRVRSSSKAAIGVLAVVIALVGSMWLAVASATPKNHGNYPVTAQRAKGAGFVGTGKGNITAFAFDVSTDNRGLHGVVLIHCAGKPGKNFASNHITSLTINGNTATFSASGKIGGWWAKAHNHSSVPLVADVTAVDNNPDMISINVHNGSTVCTASGAVTHGKIIVPVPNKGHGHDDKK